MMDFEEVQALAKQIEESDGWIISKKLRYLAVSYKIFIGNYTQLKRFLELLNHKKVIPKIWALENRDKLDQSQIEVIRLFHNYLASAKSLVEHTRIIIYEIYKDADFLTEYEMKVNDQFDNSLLSHFLQDFRNYILHKGLPLTVVRLSFNESKYDNSILIDVKSLKTWDRWSKKGREYLDNVKDDIKLHDIIVSYGSTVIDFYGWLLRRQEEVNCEAFEKMEKLQTNFSNIYNIKYNTNEEMKLPVIDKRVTQAIVDGKSFPISNLLVLGTQAASVRPGLQEELIDGEFHVDNHLERNERLELKKSMKTGDFKIVTYNGREFDCSIAYIFCDLDKDEEIYGFRLNTKL